MNKEVISEKQGIAIVIMFIASNYLINPAPNDAKADIWLAIIMALTFSILFAFFYAKILMLYPGKDLFDIVQQCFGNLIGKGICVLYILYFFRLLVIDLLDFMVFINIVGLIKTPIVLLMILAMSLTAWGTRSGIEVLGRWAGLFVIVLIFLVYFTLIISLSIIDLNNLKPFLYNGIKPVMKGAYSVFTFPFGETVIFMALFNSLNNIKASYKVYILGLLIGGTIIFSAATIGVLVLGKDAYTYYFFPSYMVVRRINLAIIIHSVEAFTAAALLIGGYVRSIVCLLACTRGISKLFSFKDYRFFVYLTAAYIVISAFITFESIFELSKCKYYICNYFALLFQVILPIVILITAKIKRRSYI
jgi:spore germination protein KB